MRKSSDSWVGLIVCVCASAAVACEPKPAAPRAQPATADSTSPAVAHLDASTEAASDAAPPMVGITHEELLRQADAEAHDAPGEAPVEVSGALVPADSTFVDETPADVARTRYALEFGDERRDRPAVERVLRVDDQGDRLLALFYGTGFVLAPGFRLGARATMGGFALIGAAQSEHRAMSPDEVRRWFLGNDAPTASVSFRRDGDSVIATRGALSVSMSSEPGATAHPLSCRLFVAMMLGGEAGALRSGCEGAKLPSRVTLRARGVSMLAFVKADFSAVQLPRASLAVPPRSAESAELRVPARSGEGGFFSPSELLSLEPVRPANAPPVQRPRNWAPVSSTLEINNNSAREVLLFVDDAAVGWLAPGRHAVFSGIQAGRHALRARTVDGVWRGEPATVSVPGRWDVVAPATPAPRR